MTELVSKINVEKIDYLANIIDKITSLHREMGIFILFILCINFKQIKELKIKSKTIKKIKAN